MDMDEVEETIDNQGSNDNLINLSLDEIVALNKRRQQKQADAESTSTKLSMDNSSLNLSLDEIIQRSKLAGAMKTPSVSKSAPNGFQMSIDNKLRKIPGFGSRPIHNRLGYYLNNNNLNKRHEFYKTPYKMSQLLAKRSKQFLVGRPGDYFNPQITIQNPAAKFISPLTRKYNGRINMVNGPRNGLLANGSAYDLTVKPFRSKAKCERFSIRNALKPDIQLEMREVYAKNTHDRMSPGDLDYDFSIYACCTSMTNHKRFSTYY